MAGTLREDLSLLLTTAQNVMQLDNSGKGTDYCIPLTTLNGFLLLTATYKSTLVKWETLLRFNGNNG
jgi:hypothetical protein